MVSLYIPRTLFRSVVTKQVSSKKISAKNKQIKNLDSSYFHDYDTTLARLERRMNEQMSSENMAALKKYDIDAITQSIGKAARIKHLSILLKFSKRFDNKPWREITPDDVKLFIAEIMQKHSSKGDETHTTSDHKKVVKIFFRWLYYGNRSSKVTYRKFKVSDPPVTEDIIVGRVKNKLVREDLLTEAEQSRLLYACGGNLRNRAILAVKFEAGDRAGEFPTTKLKHIKFDDYGTIIHVDGKTGSRPIRLIESAPDLAKWINAHPFKDNPEAPTCINLDSKHYGEPMKYSAIMQMLKDVCKKAEIKKRVYFTLIRHGEITKSANFLTSFQQKKRHGWTPNSDMPAVYEHLQDKDVDDAILNHYGLKKNDKDSKQKIPIICKICSTPNARDTTMCDNCGKPLDLKTALEVDEIQAIEKEELASTVNELKSELSNLKNFKEEMRQEFIKEIKNLNQQSKK